MQGGHNDYNASPLKASLRGELIQSGDESYDGARSVYNAMIDRHPALIARCADVADVIATVNFGRENNFLISIRSGGHSAGGLGVCDNGLVIDLSLIRCTHVDIDWAREASDSGSAEPSRRLRPLCALVTPGASGEKSCAPVPPSSKRIHTNGWPLVEIRASASTGQNCIGQ
jgi:hypothetical protein